MKLIIPKEVLGERLLPYSAKLDEMGIINDTLYNIAAMVIEKCIEKDNWNDIYIEEYANKYSWEAIGETAEEIFNFEEGKDNYEGVCKNIDICSSAVTQTVKQIIPCLYHIPKSLFSNFLNRDTIIMADVADDDDVIIDIQHYIPH